MSSLPSNEWTYDVQGKKLPWLQAVEWRAEGADPSLFPNGTLPMKRILLNEGEDTHEPATKYDAMAHGV